MMSTKNVMLYLFLATTLLITNILYAQDYKTDDRVLITIDSDEVTVNEFMNVYLKNNINEDMMSEESLDEYLDLYINYKLKVLEAEAKGMDTIKAFIKELDGYRKQLAKPYFIDPTVNELLIQEAFDRKHKAIRASHILFLCEKDALPEDTLIAYNKAMEARERVLNGENFGDVAFEVSEDKSAQDREQTERSPRIPGNRGDLGYFSVFNMVYPFETAAYNTKEGDVTLPVRSRFGYHVIKVDAVVEQPGKILAGHIFTPLRPEAPENQVEIAEESMNNAYKELNEGRSWAEVVKEYSQDKATAAKEGKIPWFNINRMVPVVIEELLVIDTGQYTKPFRTHYGIHIFKLFKTEPVGSFDDEFMDIKSKLAKDDRAKLGKSTILKQIKEEYNLTVNPPMLEELYLAISDSIFTGSWSASELDGYEGVIFTIGDSTLLQKDFAPLIELNQRKGEVMDLKAKKKLINNIFNTWVDKTCLEYEDNNLENKHLDFALLMQEYRDGILLFELMEMEVWNKAIEDTIGVQAFYEAHKDQYMWKERRVVSTFDISGFATNEEAETFATSLSKKLKKADDEEMIEIIKSDSTLKNVYNLETYEIGENSYIDNITGKGKIVNDIVINENVINITRILDVLPPSVKKFNEAKGLVTADYQAEIEKEWVKSLRQKYSYILNEEVWNSLKQ